MEGRTRQPGSWTGESQPPQDQAQAQLTNIQQYPHAPSYPAAPVPQQQQRFDAGGGFPVGQSPQVPRLPGFAGAFQQPSMPGVAVPPSPQTSGSMFMGANVQPLPGSMPMGDVMNQGNLHQHQSPSQMAMYPLELSHHQNGWQDPRPRQRRRRTQPQQQRQQQRQQPRPQQHKPRQQQPRQQQQAGDEGAEVAAAAPGAGVFVDNSEAMRMNALMYERMAPGGASVDLNKFQQRNPDKWATSAAFELCKIMKPSTRPTFKVDGGPSKLNPPFTVTVTVNKVDYTPATAQSVRLAKQLASLNFVRELVGNRPNNVHIGALKTGVVSELPVAGGGIQQQQQQYEQQQRSSDTAVKKITKPRMSSPLTPASVRGDVTAAAVGKGAAAAAGAGSAGVADDEYGSFVEDSSGEVEADSGPSIKKEFSGSPENSLAPTSVGTPQPNTLEYHRMYPGGVELRNLDNLKVKDRPAVSIAYGLCNMMVPSSRPQFCFLGNTGTAPFTVFIMVNGVRYTPATGSSIKIARSEASINFIREVVGNRVKLDLDSFSPPSALSAAESKGKNRSKRKGDDKEGSTNFLKLLHDLVTALPRTDSYTVFEWTPLEGLSSNTNAANTTSTASTSDAAKKDDSGNVGDREVVKDGAVGVDSEQRYRCVARLKLRVENVEEGLKRSEEMKTAKVLFHTSEAKLSESPGDLAAMESWKSAQEKLTALKAMPAAKIEMLTTTGEGVHKKDAKVVAARAMLFKLLPECKGDEELHSKAKSIIDRFWEEEVKAAEAAEAALVSSTRSLVSLAGGKRRLQEAKKDMNEDLAAPGEDDGNEGVVGGKSKDKSEGEGWTIVRAALNNEGGGIDKLVAEGVSLPKHKKFWKGKTLLHLAAEKGCPDATSALIRHGLDVDILDKQGRTALHLAAERGHLAVVRIMLAEGADVRVRHGQRDCSAMDEAVCKGHVEIVEAIIRAGADPGAGDCTGYRALHRAAYEDRSEMVKALLDRGVEVDPRDDDESTPVHFAAQQGSVSALVVLLQRGADPNAMDRNRDSPLHLAGLYLDNELRLLGVVEALLRWGADEEALNGEGKNIMDLVVNPRVLALLKRAPAERKVRRDENWSRRRLVVLCRARIVKGVGEGDDGCNDMEVGGDVKASSAVNGKAGAVDAGEASSAAQGGLIERVVIVKEQKIFRSMVGFL